MKANTTLLLFALALAGAGAASAQHPGGQAHKELPYVSVDTTYKFCDGTAAHWTSVKDNEFEVILKQDTAMKDPARNDDGATSLFNLAIQNIDLEATVTVLDGPIEIKDMTQPNPRWVTYKTNSSFTLGHASLAGATVNDRRIGFIRWAAKECKLKVSLIEVDPDDPKHPPKSRPHRGLTTWCTGGSPKISHDNTPPPGSSGGQY